MLLLKANRKQANRSATQANWSAIQARGPGKRGHIAADTLLSIVSWAAQTGKHLLGTQNVSEQKQKHFLSRKQNLCPQQMLRARANGETFVSATMCPRLPGP